MQLLKGVPKIFGRLDCCKKAKQSTGKDLFIKGMRDRPNRKCLKMYAGVFNQSDMAFSSEVDCEGTVLLHNASSSKRSQAVISSKEKNVITQFG